MKRKKILLPFILLLSISAFAQNEPKSFKFFKLTYLSGEAKAKGFYRRQERFGYGFSDVQETSYLTGGAALKTTNYFLHPNFLLIDIDAGYFPETNRDKYIISPDQAEVRTLKKLDLKATLFNKKKITLTSFANFDEGYQNRENLTDVKTTSNLFGGLLTLSNKYLPLSIDFHKKYWLQKEMATTRKFSMDETVFQSRIGKSFTSRDQHELFYIHSDYNSMNENLFKVNNSIENYGINDNIIFDKKRNYSFNSSISNYTQTGNTGFRRFQATENLTLKLPKNITFSSNYNYNLMRQDVNKLNQHTVQSSLNHRLFKSLETKIFAEYNQMNHTFYTETNKKMGASALYTKQIPTGTLNLFYMYCRYNQNMASAPSSLYTSNEEYTLSDDKLVLFKRPYINISSVIVKDITGTIQYQKDIDYILIDKKPYVEIRRIPGGLIQNNATVYIDYISEQPGAYKYDTDNHTFNASVLLFKRKLEIYYRFTTQDYLNLSQTEFITLDYHTQHAVGGRLDFGFVNGGAEYQDYKSTIIPYQLTKYFINFQENYHEEFLFTLSGNLQNYYMVNESKNQRYIDVSTTVNYAILKNTKISANFMYRNQAGRGIDLDLLTGRGEITTNFRQLYITLGAELYRRSYTGERINFKGAFVQIARKF